MAKTPHSQYRGPRFNLWLGTWNLHVTTKTWSSQINKHFFKSKNHQWLKLFKNHCNASKGEIKWSNLCFSRCKFSDIIELQEIKKRSDTCTYICVTEMCVCVLVAQLCPTLYDPVDCSLPGSSVHGILQARIMEWVVISFFRGLPDPRTEGRSPALQADSFLFF